MKVKAPELVAAVTEKLIRKEMRAPNLYSSTVPL
jgi:hypothetical protein